MKYHNLLFALILICLSSGPAMAQPPPFVRNQYDTNSPANASYSIGKQFDVTYFGTNATIVTKLWREYGTNVLIVDSSIGNDTTAAADPYHRPWLTAYNLFTTNGHVAYGACTVAQPGDWIVFLGNPVVPYLVPQIPLNLNGSGLGGGVNLRIMPGATLVATNYSNTNATGTDHVNLSTAGAMIMPGNNSRIIVEGTLINTNDFAQGAASIGWQMNGGTGLPFTGVTNYPPINANVWFGAGAQIIGDADTAYIGNGVTFPGSITFENVRINAGWDGFFFTGSALTVTNIKCYSYAGVYPTNGISHGMAVTSATVYDFNSVYIATGSTNVQGIVSSSAGIAVFANANVFLHGTKTIAVGNTNVVPLAYNSNPVFGDWSETDTNNITALFAQTYKFGETVRTVNTNLLVLTAGGQGGPGNVNLQYKYLNGGANGSYTNNATHWVTNSDANPVSQGGTWIAFGGANFRYFSTNGPLGPYFGTNASTPPAPNADFLRTTNFNVSALGDIAQVNFVSGQLITNVIGRPISVRATAVLTTAAVTGNAEMDLSVDQTQSGTFTVASAYSDPTSAALVLGSPQGDLTAFIQTNGVYTFTNSSTGAGNSSALKSGSG